MTQQATQPFQQATPPSAACLVYFDDSGIHTQPLNGKPQWMLGRPATGAEAPDIPLQSGIVSRNHGALRKIGQDWYYLDNPHNTNGTYHNGSKIPRPSQESGQVSSICLRTGDVLRVDNAGGAGNPQAVLMVFSASSASNNWKEIDLSAQPTVTIGRNPSCSIVFPMPYISANHASIQKKDGQYLLSDQGSKAGTYLNRRKISAPTPLRDKDCFLICDRLVIFSHGKVYFEDSQKSHQILLTTVPKDRPVVLQADIQTKQVKNNSGAGMKELIRDIHLSIREGTLVAMLGTAGAGKSTVMNCLNGMDTVGVRGSVIYRNVNLMEHFAQMKEMIGSVPQQKVFHKTFTPEQEFRFAARKRLPGDTSDAEIQKRVNETLRMLSINGVRGNRNSKLSGGEQTRVNIGIELVADRDLLCLDEPDQGLSPNYKHELFEILRDLAHKNGKCVLCIIHDVSEIDLFDQVIILAKKDNVGRLAFSGAPEEARKFFGCDIRDAYAMLDKHPERYIR